LVKRRSIASPAYSPGGRLIECRTTSEISVPGGRSCRISAWSWPTLDLSNFLWSDVDREHDLFVHAVAQSFTPP
jgi:hypothetical protein